MLQRLAEDRREELDWVGLKARHANYQRLDDILEAEGIELNRFKNVQYYMARTSHGSTLSRVVHAWVLARTDRKRSWDLFQEALASDIDDILGGTTHEGVHLGAMAGTVDLIQRCYTGLEMRHEVLWLNPRLPDGLGELKLTARYRGHWFGLHITLSFRLPFDANRTTPSSAKVRTGTFAGPHTGASLITKSLT